MYHGLRKGIETLNYFMQKPPFEDEETSLINSKMIEANGLRDLG